MKKIMVGLLLLTATNSWAQGFGKKILGRLDFGLKGGVNLSNFTDASFPTDALVGYHGGAIVAFRITDQFMIQEEFLFSLQGAKSKGGITGSQDMKLSYLSVPILLKYKTRLGLYVEAGAQASMKLDEKISGTTNGDFAKKVDAGAVGGIGYQSKLGLGFGARYVYGFTRVAEDRITYVNDFKNNTIQASIFYIF